MTDLPREQTVSISPPPSPPRVDLFGPFFVKRRRGQAKVYGAMLTCLATRAIHLEIADSLTTLFHQRFETLHRPSRGSEDHEI